MGLLFPLRRPGPSLIVHMVLPRLVTSEPSLYFDYLLFVFLSMVHQVVQSWVQFLRLVSLVKVEILLFIIAFLAARLTHFYSII